MTSPASRIALFAAALLAAFGVGVALGAWVDPPGRGGGETQAHGEMGAGEMPHMADSSPAPVRGLGATENGLRLIVADPQRPAGAGAPLRFRVAEQDGETIADFAGSPEREPLPVPAMAARSEHGYEVRLAALRDRDVSFTVEVR